MLLLLCLLSAVPKYLPLVSRPDNEDALNRCCSNSEVLSFDEEAKRRSDSCDNQKVEAVVELLNYMGKPANPLPEAVQFRSMVLVLSNKKGVSMTSAVACSCPSFVYQGRPCKHQRKHFAESKKRGQTLAKTLEEHDRNLLKMPASYRRMVRSAREGAEADNDPDSLIRRGGFKPIYPGDEPSKADPKTNRTRRLRHGSYRF